LRSENNATQELFSEESHAVTVTATTSHEEPDVDLPLESASEREDVAEPLPTETVDHLSPRGEELDADCPEPPPEESAMPTEIVFRWKTLISFYCNPIYYQ